MTGSGVFALIAFLPIALTACSGDNTEQLALQAATGDLQCPSGSIDVQEVSRDQPYRDDHVYIHYDATGCEKLGRYACQYIDTPYGPASSRCTLVGLTSVSSSIVVNGSAFVPGGEDLCRSGASQEFVGVDMKVPDGSEVRVVQTPELAYEVVVHTSNGDQTPPLVQCATVHMTQDASTGFSGDVTLDCTVGNWVVQGSASFVNCV